MNAQKAGELTIDLFIHQWVIERNSCQKMKYCFSQKWLPLTVVGLYFSSSCEIYIVLDKELVSLGFLSAGSWNTF